MNHRKILAAAGSLVLVCSLASGDQSDWQQVVGGQAATAGGFGNIANISIGPLVRLDGEVYAATFNLETGTEIWRSTNGLDWTLVHGGGIASTDFVLNDLIVFRGGLYAAPRTADPCIWRSTTGSDWVPVQGPCADPHLDNETVLSFAIFGEHLYASTHSASRPQIWRSADGSTWEPVVEDGFGFPYSNSIPWLEVFDGQLYSTTGHGCQIWRSADGTAWTQVLDSCLGSRDNVQIMESFKGVLYAGAGVDGLAGFILWSSPDGESWSEGAHEPSSHLAATDDWFYSTTAPFDYEIIMSSNGTDWTVDNEPYFGNPNNWYYSGLFIIDGYLYTGVQNSAEGGQLWRKFLGLFADGFESGDTAAWTATVPRTPAGSHLR